MASKFEIAQLAVAFAALAVVVTGCGPKHTAPRDSLCSNPGAYAPRPTPGQSEFSAEMDLDSYGAALEACAGDR